MLFVDFMLLFRSGCLLYGCLLLSSRLFCRVLSVVPCLLLVVCFLFDVCRLLVMILYCLLFVVVC